MTDTGQVPGEGLPENAGMVEQQGVPAPGAYAYLSAAPAEDEEDLLLPGAQGAWGNEVPPPPPEPVVETVHEPGPHEMSGRDSGSVDLSGVQQHGHTATHERPAPAAPRRPLHLGPPVPTPTAGPVRSLADRGPADVPVRQSGPPTIGPEYLDIPQTREEAAGAAAPWGAQQRPAETVAPPPEPVGAAQAAVSRVTAEAAGSRTTGRARPEGAPQGEPAPQSEPAPAPADQPAGSARPQTDGDTGQDTPADAPDAVNDGDAAAARAEEAGAPGVSGTESAVAQTDGDAGAGVEAAAAAAGAVAEADAGGAAAEAQGAVVQQDAGSVTEAASSAAAGEGTAEAVDGAGTQGAVEGDAPDGPDAAAVAADADAADARQTPVAASAEESTEPPAPAAAEAGQATESPAPETTGEVAGDAVNADVPVGTEAAATEAVAAEAVTAEAEAGPAEQAPVPHAVDPAPQSAAGSGEAEKAVAPPEPQGVEAHTPVPQPLGQKNHTAPEAAAEQDPASTAEAPADAVAAAPAADANAAPEEPEAPEATEPATPLQGPQQTLGTPLPAPAGVEHAEPQPPSTDAPGTDAAAAPATPEAPGVHQHQHPHPEPHPDQSIGQFVPVEGTVPTTPHLAPTPPQPVPLPTEEQTVPEAATAVPAPRRPEAAPEPAPELVQNADDLDTQGAGVDDGQSPREEIPAAPAYDDAEREAVLKVMRERRDIRNGFRSDPIPHEVLLRVLEAAHTAPSVGHSQPWDFVVIRSEETRRSMHELAMRQREAYAKSLPKGRAKQFKELKIEAILDTPVNIVVTADPTRGGRHTLGRHTQPQMAPYSSALAVENLWLAARAEGLGVGWVSFFDEREMVRVLGLPEHLEVVAYLCVGYVDEFPDEPELMQAGWSKRRPLSWVVHEETYGRRALPGEEPHDLLAETVSQIRPLDAKALGEAWERQKRMTKPAGALGMLEIISAQLSGLSRQCPPPIPEPAALAIFAGDHGVHAQGVTPWPQEVTAQMVANFLGGGAVCNAFASQVGAEICVVDVGVSSDLPATPGLLPRKIRAGTSDMTAGPAMSREEAKKAIEVGIETARDLVAAGNRALLTGEMGIANTTASAALIAVFTGADPAEVTGRGTGINDETLARKTEVVRRALELHQPDPADPIGVLAAIGGLEHAAMVGLLLGGASLRTPVILDGVSAGAAALVARAIAPEVLAACIAGHRSAEPGHVAALNKLGLRPLVDLDLRLGEGTGALLALPLVQSTARAMHEVATFDSAGVTEK